MWRSEPQMPARVSRTRTAPGSGSGTGYSRSSKSPPYALRTATRPVMAAPPARRPGGSGSLLRLELGLVLPDEGPDLVGHVEELHPLLLVERDREATQPVDRDAALVAHPQADPLAGPGFQRLVLGPQSGQLVLVALVGHRRLLPTGPARPPAGRRPPACRSRPRRSSSPAPPRAPAGPGCPR